MVLSRVSFALIFLFFSVGILTLRFPLQIWDLSDPTGRGFLDKPGMFVALKLVALAQAGNDINMSNIFLESQNPPKVVSVAQHFVRFLFEELP